MRLEETGTRLEQAVLEVPETEASGKAWEGSDSDDDDDDDEGWITPENLRQVCEEMGGVLDELPQSLPVGCITTDFAMQVQYIIIHTPSRRIIHCFLCFVERHSSDGPKLDLSRRKDDKTDEDLCKEVQRLLQVR